MGKKIKSLVRGKQVADVEKLCEVLGHTMLKCEICSEMDFDMNCHKRCIETAAVLCATKVMIAKQTPNALNMMAILIDLLEDCGDACAQNQDWHCQDCATSCYNTSEVIKTYLQAGSLPSFGRGTVTSRAISNIKSKQQELAHMKGLSEEQQMMGMGMQPVQKKKGLIRRLLPF